MARVTEFIDANLGAALPVDRLAIVAGLSRAHFVRQFTANRGVPPSGYVLARRLDRTERLRLATGMKVGAIAKANGFAGANDLAKAVRRLEGKAPLEFRATRLEAN